MENIDLYLTRMAIEPLVFFNVLHLLLHGTSSSKRNSHTHTYCQAFGSGVTTYCNDFDQSLMEIEHRSLACKASAVATVPHGGVYAPLIKMIGKCIFYLMFDFKFLRERDEDLPNFGCCDLFG